MFLQPVITFKSIFQNNLAILFKMEYTGNILFKGNLGKGGAKFMTSYELIWRLIVLLLLSNNNENQDTNKE